MTFGEHAERWLTNRQLKLRTRYHYRKDVALKQMSADRQGARLRPAPDDPVRCRPASVDRLLNPCPIRDAGNAREADRAGNLPELEALTKAMPERYQLMVLLAARCGLRFGEITEHYDRARGNLDRHDVHFLTAYVAGVWPFRRPDTTRVTTPERMTSRAF